MNLLNPDKLALCSILLLVWYSRICFGFNDQSDLTAQDISVLDLEDLLEINVSVASARPELIPNTPAVVSRYQAEDLKSMGLHSLKDFLSFVPGVTVSNTYGSSVVSMRGIFEAFNQKVLFLLDGIPYFMPSHSDIPLLGVPMEAISHIEIIRGPGAVYHGTNSSAGVINVVTKKEGASTENFSGVVGLSLGSNSLLNSSGFASYQVGEEGSINLSYETQRMDTYEGFTRGAAANPFSGTAPGDGFVPRGEEMDSLMIHYKGESTSLLFQAFQSDLNILGGFSALDSQSIHGQEGIMLHGSHALSADRYAINLYADYNQYFIYNTSDSSTPL